MPLRIRALPVQHGVLSSAASEASSLLYTRSSSRPVLKMLQLGAGFASGPFEVPSRPFGKKGAAISPIDRVEKAMPYR
jgi:hypothetical protein